MPLRDHFRPPVDDVHSWDELHGGWPMMIVKHLQSVLPEPYFAAPGVHLGSLFEVDIATYQESRASSLGEDEPDEGGGGLAVAVQAPPKPTVSLEPRLPQHDTYGVRIYTRRHRRLVAAIEILSPSNKDRPATRLDFISKAATLLKHGVCVSIVDVVTTSHSNLYAELLELIEGADPALPSEPPSIYAVTMRVRWEGDQRRMDNWYYPLSLGQPLPPLPIWLSQKRSITLDLEESYEETCQTLRIR